jgi:hypothetical protein
MPMGIVRVPTIGEQCSLIYSINLIALSVTSL